MREFIASEAMAALGVPTTRALSLTVTGGLVTRDMFYKCANFTSHTLSFICEETPTIDGMVFACQVLGSGIKLFKAAASRGKRGSSFD